MAIQNNIQVYNKAIGAIVGGVLALASVWGFDHTLNPEQISAITIMLSTLGAFFAPENKKRK